VKNSEPKQDKPVDPSSSAKPNLRGISNPRGYLPNDDRYVPSGAVLDRDAFLKKYLSPVADEQQAKEATKDGDKEAKGGDKATVDAGDKAAKEGDKAKGGDQAAKAGDKAAKGETQQQGAAKEEKKKARQQELASVSWPERTSNTPNHQPETIPAQLTVAGLQSLNSPDAPTLNGGIPVPGGHIIWVPETSLSAAQPAAEPAPAHAADAASIVRPTRAGPGEIVLPLPVTAYSKVVAYGPDGRREFAWYRPDQRAAAAAPAATSQALRSSGPRAAAGSRRGRGRALSAKDRRIERDLLLRLMSAPAQDAVGSRPSLASRPGRAQQLAQVSAAAAGGGRALQRVLLAMAASVAVVLWSGRMLR
jgi:hypothetical protein